MTIPVKPGEVAAEALAVGIPPSSETSFGIYVHWPFCASKCPYCDFNSHVRHTPVDEARYRRAFARELASFAARAPGRTVTSIFLGGGTPSLMAPATVAGILEAIAGCWPVAADAEITLEANPSSVEADRFRGYRAAGVNRLSLGVQALNDADLKALGRLHDAPTALAAIALAREIFPRLSFDLIYARPGQSVSAWTTELRTAVGLAADHLSAYQLTIEPGTMFHALRAAGRLAVPDSETLAEFYATTREICAAAGLPAYEISNHAVPGAESRHNLTYWRYQDYVGVGPGAHGRLTIDGDKHATQCERQPEEWVARVEAGGDGLVEDTVLSRGECGDEMLLMGMRLGEGISRRRYEEIAGRPLDSDRIEALSRHGMVAETADGKLHATPAGFMVLDAVVADLAA